MNNIYKLYYLILLALITIFILYFVTEKSFYNQKNDFLYLKYKNIERNRTKIQLRLQYKRNCNFRSFSSFMEGI